MNYNNLQKFIVSDELKKSSLQDVFYEIQSLFNSYCILTKKIIVTTNSDYQIIINLTLESALLHCRNLMDFFENENRTIYKNKENDDILCSDFFNYEIKILNIDKKYKNRINKELTHLTYNRTEIKGNLKKWPLDEIIKPILTQGLDFIKYLKKNNFLGIVEINKWNELENNIELLIK